jgi:hypothetical protein
MRYIHAPYNVAREVLHAQRARRAHDGGDGQRAARSSAARGMSREMPRERVQTRATPCGVHSLGESEKW